MRLLKVVGAAVLLLFILLLAQENAALTAGAVGGLALAALLWWWLRNPEAAASVASLVVTLVATSEIATFIAARRDSVDALQLGFAFWIFAAVTATVTWLAPRHHGNRAVTIATANGILITSAIAAYPAPTALPPLSFALAMAVVVWRSRRRKWTPQPYDGKDLAELARGGDRTYGELQTLAEAEGWTLLGPQHVQERQIEQLVQNTTATYVIETRQWGGAVSLVTVEQGQEHKTDTAYAYNGELAELAARIEPIVDRVTAVRRHQGGDVEGIVAFWDDTTLPEGEPVELDVLAARGKATRVTLVRGDDLAELLRRRDRP